MEETPATPVDDVTALRQQALAAFHAGDTQRAIAGLQQLVNRPDSTKQMQVQDCMLLAACYFKLGDMGQAVSMTRRACAIDPQDAQAAENLGVCLMRTGENHEALACLLRSVEKNPAKANVYDALAQVLFKLNRIDMCIEAGTQALMVKDRQAAAKQGVPALPRQFPPPFRNDQPHRNIISFSLYGSHPRYFDGARRNVTFARVVYPSWRCRFYCEETVPEAFWKGLQQEGAEIRIMPKGRQQHEGAFWRFLVVDDPEVDRYLIRDCDSVVNVQERVAVDEWLESDRYFHVMRDWYTHTEVMLAGMWGGVGRTLPSVTKRMATYRPSAVVGSNLDQLFLRDEIWPIVRQSVLMHDSKFLMPGSRRFPELGRLPQGYHVGQNDHIWREREKK